MSLNVPSLWALWLPADLLPYFCSLYLDCLLCFLGPSHCLQEVLPGSPAWKGPFPQHLVGIILKDPKAVVFAGSSSPSSVLQMRRLRLSKVKSLALDNLLSWDSKQGDLAAPAPPLLMHIPMSIVFLSSQTDEGHVLKEI